MTLMFHFRASCKRFEAWPLAGTRRLRSSHEADLETLRGSELDLFFVISWLFVFLVLLMVLFIWYLCVTNSFAYSVPYRIPSNHIISIHIHIHYHIISCHIISYIIYIYCTYTYCYIHTYNAQNMYIYRERVAGSYHDLSGQIPAETLWIIQAFDQPKWKCDPPSFGPLGRQWPGNRGENHRSLYRQSNHGEISETTDSNWDNQQKG